jgi:hypothetical protein
MRSTTLRPGQRDDAIGTRAWSQGLTVALALLALAFFQSADAASATPARFVVEKCDSVLPGGGVEGAQFSASTTSWVPENSCAFPAGALGIRLDALGGGTDACCDRSTRATSSGAAASAFWTLPFEVTPGGSIEEITASARMCGDSPTVFGFVLDPAWNPECNWQTRTFPSNSSGTILASIVLGCDSACDTSHKVIAARNFVATEVDPRPPSINGAAGTILGGGVLHGHQSLSAAATDRGGGLTRISVRANGDPAGAPQSFACKTVKTSNSSVAGVIATEATPCPAAGQESWSLDTAVPPFHYGPNSLQVCAEDFATIGDPNQTCSTWSVNVDNTCTESSTASGDQLTAAFRRNSGNRITVSFGVSAKFEGRLTDASGRPVAGATVCVETRTLSKDGAIALVAQPTTDALGRYSYILPPGPNREVVVAYRHDAHQLERHLRYFARARPTLYASPQELQNGDSVDFRGQLSKPSPGGRVVIIQAAAAGSSRWITFRKATTNEKGAFHTRYRFTSTTHATRYRFRALVPRQTGYPWIEGHSKPAEVLVTASLRSR